MKWCIVCLLVALACVAAMPAPQQSETVGATSTGPLTTLYELATLLPNTFLSTAQNAMRGIPFANLFPAALQTGLQVGKNVAEGMDHTITGITGGRGGTNALATLLNPLNFLGGFVGGGQNIGQAGSQFGGAQSNPPNGLGNLLNTLNPLNYLNGAATPQNGQQLGAGGQTNPLGTLGSALNNLNPLNILGGALSQNGQQIFGQQGNYPIITLSNGAAQALNQLSPAALAQYLSAQSPNQQFPNAASNVPSLVLNASNSESNATAAKPGTVPVRTQNEETP